MIFRDRIDAGQKLAQKLEVYKKENPVVLALPRGGVPIGFEIAKKLNAPLDVLVARKLGAPLNPEFGIGAIAEGSTEVLDQEIIDYLGLTKEEISQVEKVEQKELARRVKKYRGKSSLPKVTGKTVILVDDGLATGVTAKAAIKAILKRNPKKLIVAIPVCAADATDSLRSLVRPFVDEVVCLATPLDFAAVGLWYQNFGQVSDEEVINYLHR